MFTKTKDPTQEKPVSGNGTTIINAGTVLKGDINSKNDIRIDGTIIGNITCQAKIVIGANGDVQGDIDGNQADIVGKVTGCIKTKDLLQLRGECTINGDVQAGKLQIEPSAIFNGKCQMGSAIVKENGATHNISTTKFTVERGIGEMKTAVK
ncbi:MAG: polymer-forming cytoskeletal protein [Chitinophagaceae bacterium]|jgi:cytoskeletal protein CcmA (bactofilin family)|nr:polymer-forming cytoskeletal protein [Chitinophagaceae bacterium]